jgi:hypothetical protein
MRGGEGSDETPPRLLKSVVTDSGRHFFDAPPAMTMKDCALRLTGLDGAEIVSLVPAEAGEWLTFRFEGREFAAADPLGEVWFYAEDPETPDGILQKIALWIVARPKPS